MMELPTKELILRRIGRAIMRKWGDPEVLFNAQQFVDKSGSYWFRHPDSDAVWKVTVEELPRSEWPNMLGEDG